MDSNNKKKLRDILRLSMSLIFFWLYIPHVLMVFIICVRGGKRLIFSDIELLKIRVNIKLNNQFALIYFLHNNRYYRNLFYHRIGPIKALLISWLRPGDRYFSISATTKIGEGFSFVHPYATIINAESIGNNFSCIHCCTIGKKNGKRPIIGNNVSMGAGSIVIGNIHIGNNVIIGAGAVVVKDVPDNCAVAGNPAKIVKYFTS